MVAYQLGQKDVPLRIIPFGKAFGSIGAVVAGQQIWIDALIQAAKSYIYSTALSPALCYGLMDTLELIRKSDEKRKKLQHLITIFRKKLNNQTNNGDILCPYSTIAIGVPVKSTSVCKAITREIYFLYTNEAPNSKNERHRA